MVMPTLVSPLSPLGRADDAAARLAGVLHSAMDAIVTVDASQRILIYNQAAESIFGWPASAMLGESLERLIPARFRSRLGLLMTRFGEHGVTSRRMGGSAVVYALRASGEEFPVDASISQVDTPDGKLFTVILRDVTARIKAEDEHARLMALLDSAMDGIISIDEAQCIVLYNQAAERMFGWPAAQALGQPLEKLIPTRFHAGHRAHVVRFHATGTTSRSMGDGTVLYGLRASGEEFPMEAAISQLETETGKLFTVILRDVSERMRAQAELSTFAAEAHHIREGEKSRVARELHDDLAQSLTALKMDTIWVRDRLAHAHATPEVAARLSGMVAMLDDTLTATRRIAADLRPLLLDDLGLVPALEWLVQSFTQRTGVPCALEVADDLELEEPYATAFFRIVQESLVNVSKHAKATHAQVRIELSTAAVTLDVRDNGLGFLPTAPRKPLSLGLMGLRERVRLLQGSIAIHSKPGEGCHVEVRVPLH